MFNSLKEKYQLISFYLCVITTLDVLYWGLSPGKSKYDNFVLS